MAMLAEAVVLRRGRSAGFEVGSVRVGKGRPKGEAMVGVGCACCFQLSFFYW